MRINNQALSSITKQTKITAEQLQERKDYLQQVEQDLDEGSTDRHTKYKELKKRDEMMTNFMETYQANMNKEKQSKSMLN